MPLCNSAECFMGVSSSDPENHIELLPNQNAKLMDA